MLIGWFISLLATCQAFHNFTDYLSHDEMYEFLEATHRSYPNMTHIYSIGKSLQGKDLWVMAVSSHSPDKHVLLRPETKYVGNIHGNEATSREMLIRFIDLLLTQYGEDDSITHLMDTARVHVMPTMNPDGYGITSKWNCSGVYGRYNMAQVDLNRDFPDYFNPTYQTREMMQPESGAVADWIDSTQFVLSAGFHGGALVANYPYDSNSEPQSWMSYGAPSICPDDATFQYLAKAYSYNHRDMTNSSTCRTFRDGITNGAEWYVALGTMQDYNYVWGGCMDLTIEIGCCKHPPYSHIERYWLDNKLAMIEYLRKVDLGVKGIVTDETGKPVPNAVIQVNSTLSVRTTPLGEYWKILLPGTHKLKVSVDDVEVAAVTIDTSSDSASVYNITTSEIGNFISATPPSSTNTLLVFGLSTMLFYILYI